MNLENAWHWVIENAPSDVLSVLQDEDERIREELCDLKEPVVAALREQIVDCQFEMMHRGYWRVREWLEQQPLLESGYLRARQEIKQLLEEDND